MDQPAAVESSEKLSQDRAFDEFAARRSKICELLGDDVLVLFSAPVHIRNNDVEHSYRQHSDFYYVTGFAEPEAACILSKEHGMVLFVRPRDRERETWEGRRAGVEGAVDVFGATAAHPITTLAEKLPDYLEDKAAVHYLLGEERAWDELMMNAVGAVRARRRKRVTAPRALCDARRLLHSLRLIKSTLEIELMARAGQIAADGHSAAMRAVRPGMYEWQLQDVVESTFRAAGARTLAYESIVGAGINATILHYRENESAMQDGDLVLIDAGCEWQSYASDITRTFPVNGRFSAVQARLYQYVLDAQLAAIEKTAPGVSVDDVHQAAWDVLRDGLRKEGLLDGLDPADSDAEKKRVNQFYMHRTSHYLGMDVHDVGDYYLGKDPLPLAEGAVITVEPGLYFAPDDLSIPEELRGIGIRIEDDVLVTSSGPRVLTAGVPKTIEAIESACRGES